MTDNRTNEPNKYSGFLARQNHQRDPWRGIGAKCLCGKVFDLDADHALHQVDEILRAALVAAQGAAPPVSSFDTTAERVKTGADSLHVATVLPSSGVDEDALAEVLREAEQSWHLSDEKWQQSYACGAPDLKSKYIARAVAEWLKGQER